MVVGVDLVVQEIPVEDVIALAPLVPLIATAQNRVSSGAKQTDIHPPAGLVRVVQVNPPVSLVIIELVPTAQKRPFP